MTILKLGTRKSPLALAQANEVARKISKNWPEITVQIVSMSTSGDQFLNDSLAAIGGKGLFTKELEEALLEGAIDIAVHSMKDVPTELPDGLVIECVLPREDVRDALISHSATTIADLPKGSVFGTSSLRRAAQIRHLRPDIIIVPLRGNVGTRIAKIERGDAVATMLAQAGLNRLALTNIPATIIPTSECLPAVAQGAIGIESRAGDEQVSAMLAPLHCKDSYAAVLCERAFLRVLDGSCRTPIAGLATISGAHIDFEGLLATNDGTSCKRTHLSGDINDADKIGKEAGEQLRRF